MPFPSPSSSACFPLMSTIDVVRPTIFHRGSLPTAVRSRLSGDCAPTGVAIHASTAMRNRLADVVVVVTIMLGSPGLEVVSPLSGTERGPGGEDPKTEEMGHLWGCRMLRIPHILQKDPLELTPFQSRHL